MSPVHPPSSPSAVDEVMESGILKRVLAQVEIDFSNSLIESGWRILKHQWLYLNMLDSVETVQKLVDIYVDQHKIQTLRLRDRIKDEKMTRQLLQFNAN